MKTLKDYIEYYSNIDKWLKENSNLPAATDSVSPLTKPTKKPKVENIRVKKSRDED